MSIDINSQCVRSKYFTSQTAMDESLSDFQETKQNCKGPKAVQKAPKTKGRKVTKRIKGQKDIRTALKGKKNELISYSKEFDTLCKKSGINVDSEELQLAIALSKSLQSETSDDASASQSTTTQSRIAKIRTTLQEYGFKVPETKITVAHRKTKKNRKDYKLLNTTEEEKHQRITSRYSQILFENLNCTKLIENPSVQSNLTAIYNIATNLEYEYMKDNNIFYVNNLIERTIITKGSLLRDWSEIPGRPVSPHLFDRSTMDFSEILCSQDELDIILSGPIKSANKIIASKQKDNVKNIACDKPKVTISYDRESTEIFRDNVIENYNIDDNSIIIVENANDTKAAALKPVDETKVEVLQVTDTRSNITFAEKYRSCSPDIFDDEVSCIMETPNQILSQGQKTKVFTEETNYMDLTECANNNVLSQNTDKAVFISQNITKTKPDDFMELTECVVSTSQGIQENINEIDLTQSPDEKSFLMGKNHSNCVDSDLNYDAESPDCSFSQRGTSRLLGSGNKTVKDNIDLTQSFIEDNNKSISLDANNQVEKSIDLGMENLCESSKNDIDLTQSSNEDENRLAITQENSKIPHNNAECMDLTQSSKSSVDIDDLPEINVCNTQNSQSNLDDTIILNEEEYKGADGKLKKSVFVQDDRVFDLTQATDENLAQSDSIAKAKTSKVSSQSFYEDFIHDHSDSKENVDNIELCGDNNSALNTSKESNEIDLTQSSDGSERNDGSLEPGSASENIPNNSSLGKKDDISIDYDEICEYVSNKESTKGNNCIDTDKGTLSLKYDSSISQVSDIVDRNHDLVSSSRQNSDVFDLTDKELDYSLHKSRFDVHIDNYDFDFEVMDNISNEGSPKKSIDVRNSTLNKESTFDENFLPEVNIKRAVEKCIETPNKTKTSSPSKVHDAGHSIRERVPVVTPKNSEYIIKTDEVTPMLDFASMTTPQRNKELDRYGLKPFKRKRAIQILTHLYNQTHPVVEPFSDDEQPSPPKKPKHSQPLHASPSKLLKSPSNSEEINRNFNSPRKEKTIRNSNSPKNPLPSHASPSKLLKSPRISEELNKNLNSPRKEKTIRNSKSPRNVSETNRNINSPRRKEGNSSKECVLNVYELTSEVPNIKRVDCDPDDWVFQKREKAKVQSCRVPLHIAFHNYVSSRQGLREAILKYEPVNIDVIHKDLVSYGHRYDPKDLLRFLDKKCITVKTADNNARNKR